MAQTQIAQYQGTGKRKTSVARIARLFALPASLHRLLFARQKHGRTTRRGRYFATLRPRRTAMFAFSLP